MHNIKKLDIIFFNSYKGINFTIKYILKIFLKLFNFIKI